MAKRKEILQESIKVQVSRQSGMVQSKFHSTFGASKRFGCAVNLDPLMTLGAGSSPWGNKFFGRAAYMTGDDERGPRASLGKGERAPLLLASTSKYVDPCTYDPVYSNCKARSPLDGEKFCTTTMKKRTKIQIGGGEATDAPGPGRYDPSPPIGAGKPAATVKGRWRAEKVGCGNESLSPPTPTPIADAHAARKSFAKAKRWGAKADGVSQSPSGDQFYCHVKMWKEADYLKLARAASMGKGQRSDWSKATSGGRSSAGPGSYEIISSCAKPTSALDGMMTKSIPNRHQWIMRYSKSSKKK